MSKFLSLVAAATLLASPAVGRAADTQLIKIATLAPAGSSWMKLMEEWRKNVEKRTEGRVKVKFFPGGIQGDERDVVRKIRAGQLQGAVVTAVGLGLVQPDVRVLELPFMVKSDAELDYIRTTLAPEFEKKFEEKDFILLAWGDLGWVHLFTNTPVTSLSDLSKVKMWAWVDDPIVKKMFERLKINGVPLGVPDVLPSLQTGLIDACYGSALSTLVLQWHTKVKHMTSMPMSLAVGASILSKSAWTKIPEADRAILKEEGKALEKKLIELVRNDNKRALNKMKSLGLQVVESPPALVKEFEKQAHEVWKDLAGTIYTPAFLNRVKDLVAEKRK